jgi:hypothetical protein
MSGPTPRRVQVQKWRVENQAYTVDLNATEGAQIGVNLFDASGNVITQAQWNALTSGSSGTQPGNIALGNYTTDDLNEGTVNLYFTALRAQNAVGGILENSANVTLAYVAGTSIEANLTTVTPSTGGTLQATLFDAYGRIEKTQAITWETAGSVALTYNSAANTVTAALNITGVTAGTYGDGTHVPTLTVDVDGRITGASDTAINFPAAPVTSVFGRTGAVVAANGDYTFAQIGSTPTTLSGYGITNAVTNTTQVIAGQGLSGGGALSGNVTLSLASQAAATLLGVPAGAGAVPTPITLGTNLSMTSGGVLNATGGGGGGTVTSVGLTAPTQLSVTGSPITGAGTLALAWVNQNANLVLAGPSSGAAGAPGFRALVAADIPSLAYVSSTAAEAANTVLAGPSSGSSAAPTFRNLLAADIAAALPKDYKSGLVASWNSGTSITFSTGHCAIPSTATLLEFPSATTLSGLSLTASTWYHAYAYNNSGTPAIELVTTAPTSYFGTAYTKTGDTTRRYLCSLYSNSSSQIAQFTIIGNLFCYTNPGTNQVVSSGNATTSTVVSCSTYAPVTATVGMFRLQSNGTATYTAFVAAGGQTASGSNAVLVTGTTGVPLPSYGAVPFDASQNVAYIVNASGANAYLFVTGHYFNS